MGLSSGPYIPSKIKGESFSLSVMKVIIEQHFGNGKTNVYGADIMAKEKVVFLGAPFGAMDLKGYRGFKPIYMLPVRNDTIFSISFLLKPLTPSRSSGVICERSLRREVCMSRALAFLGPIPGMPSNTDADCLERNRR